MLWQRSANYTFTMLGGYVIGPYPPAVQALQQTISDLVKQPAVTLSSSQQMALRSQLLALNVNTVIVDPAVVPGATRSLFTQILGAPPVAEDGLLIWPVR
jgi:hypothetical protein